MRFLCVSQRSAVIQNFMLQLFLKAEINVIWARPEEWQDFGSIDFQACVIDAQSFERQDLNTYTAEINKQFVCPVLVLAANNAINQPYVTHISIETPPHEIRRIVENNIEIYGQKAPKFKGLNALEEMILKEIAQTPGDKQIAHNFNLPLYKVKYHLRCIYKKNWREQPHASRFNCTENYSIMLLTYNLFMLSS